MKKIFFVVLLLAPLMYFGCKPGAGGDPKVVVSQFFEALHKKDIPAARKLATAESKSMLDRMEASLKMKDVDEANAKFDPKLMQIGEPVIDGDKASVSIKKTDEKQTIKFTLKKENGDWKIAFDEATLMANAMEQMKKSGINIADSIGKAMKEFKNVNLDSLKQGMKDAMDSVNKELKKIDNK
ncbi:MAG: hypothetical protein ABI402_02555 [Ferruginibacter sp.]